MTINCFNFPCGERHIQLNKIPKYGELCDIEFNWNQNAIWDLLLTADAIKRSGGIVYNIIMPYVPFSRQDRVMIEGEPLSIKVFADLVNSIGAQRVIITDPHSDVTPALINNCFVIPQEDIFSPMFKDKEDFYLISPDAGALKKIYKLAWKLKGCLGVVECSKQRDIKTGEITQTDISCGNLWDKDCYIVDDICDGGRTFIEIAKLLKCSHAGKIILMVSHGFFTKGIEVFDGLIDEIYTREGKIK